MKERQKEPSQQKNPRKWGMILLMAVRGGKGSCGNAAVDHRKVASRPYIRSRLLRFMRC